MNTVQFAKFLSRQGKTISDTVRFRLFSDSSFVSSGKCEIRKMSAYLLHCTECYSVVGDVYYLRCTGRPRLCK